MYIGFGITGYLESLSNELLKVQLSIKNTEKCGLESIDNTQLCAGGDDGKGWFKSFISYTQKKILLHF